MDDVIFTNNSVKIGRVTCSSGDTLADRQQTIHIDRHTNTLITILRIHTSGQNNLKQGRIAAAHVWAKFCFRFGG